jgi:hypothetical protein
MKAGDKVTYYQKCNHPNNELDILLTLDREYEVESYQNGTIWLKGIPSKSAFNVNYFRLSKTKALEGDLNERLILLPNGYQLWWNEAKVHKQSNIVYGRLGINSTFFPSAWYYINDAGVVSQCAGIEETQQINTVLKDIIQQMVDIVDDHEDKSVDEVFGIDDIKVHVRKLQDMYCK